MLSSASALVEYEGENSSLTLRLALDVGGGASFNPEPEIPYPDDIEPIFFAGLRVLMDSFVGEHLRFEVNAYQNGYTLLDLEATLPFNQPYRTKYLRHDWLDSEKGRMLLGLDQLSVKIFAGPVDFTIGRQPIGLSNNFIFTPNDFFYPFGSTAVDREFRPGVDAIRMDARIGTLSKLSLYAVMGYDDDGKPSWKNSALLARSSVNIIGTDWIMFGGKLGNRLIAGCALNGDADVVGYRAEANISYSEDTNDVTDANIAIGVDRRFQNTLHIMVEYFWNKSGKMNARDYLAEFSQKTDTADPFLGVHYLGLSMSGELLPVLTIQGVILMNMIDPSFMLSPGITYSAEEELDFILSASIPIGKWASFDPKAEIPLELNSEFGFYPYSVQLQGRWYF